MGNKPIVHAPIATGSTEPRDIRDRFADWCNVKDFGAKGDGLTDDSSAFLAAQASGAPAIMVPEGSYYITENIPGIFYSFGEVEKTGIGNVTIINLLANGSVPVGTVIWLSTVTVPAGFLLCNGQAVARDTYPDLFNTIGTTYGAGDGSTTFNLPNLIDKFIEGANSNIGDSVAAGLPDIKGSTGASFLGGASTYAAGAFTVGNGDSRAVGTGSNLTYKYFNFNASNYNSIYGNSSTVQPPAVKLLPCIKAYSDVDNLGSLDVAQLENYVQNNCVHTSGAESISGVKTFTTVLAIQKGEDADITVATDHNINSYVTFPDKNGIDFAAIQSKYGAIYNEIRFMLRKRGDATTPLSGLTAVSFRYNANTDAFSFVSGTDVTLGDAGNARWKQLFATTTTIATSDEREKSSISSIPDEVLDAWGSTGFVQYQFNDAVEKKGENARLHSGLVAQRIDEAFKARGLDASRYALFCYDAWEAEPEERDEQGNVVSPARPAGDEYSLRYEEALCMEAAYQRRRADRAEARIASLEERLAALEAKFEQ